jgi:DNA-binding NtrC family response regulator
MADAAMFRYLHGLDAHPTPEKVLVIDYDADNALLLTRSIRRKFPSALVVQSRDAVTTLTNVIEQKFDVLVVHRTEQIPAVELIKTVRKLDEQVVIIAVSGFDRSEDVLKAGATGFLRYDEWLRLGTVIANALQFREKSPAC